MAETSQIKINEKLANMWDGVRIIQGEHRHSQSQNSKERTNQDVHNMLTTWLITNLAKKC